MKLPLKCAIRTWAGVFILVFIGNLGMEIASLCRAWMFYFGRIEIAPIVSAACDHLISDFVIAAIIGFLPASIVYVVSVTRNPDRVEKSAMPPRNP